MSIAPSFRSTSSPAMHFLQTHNIGCLSPSARKSSSTLRLQHFCFVDLFASKSQPKWRTVHLARSHGEYICFTGKLLSLKVSSLNYFDDVQVLVGPEKKRFMVYKEEICSRSSFFQARCSGRWNKPTGEPKPIDLTDEEPSTFNLYLRVLYSGKVEFDDIEEPLPGEEGIPQHSRERCRMAKAYILADKLQDLKSCNILIDAFDYADTCSTYPLAVGVISFIVNNTGTTSPLRDLTINYFCRIAEYISIRELCECDSIPKEFICEVFTRKTIEHPNCCDTMDLDDPEDEGRLTDEELKDAKIRRETFEKARKACATTEEYTKAHELWREGKGRHPALCRNHQHDDLYPPCYLTPEEGATPHDSDDSESDSESDQDSTLDDDE